MEQTTVVKFGTDGWRGIIADDFTYENVRVAARAIALYVLKHENAGGRRLHRLGHALRLRGLRKSCRRGARRRRHPRAALEQDHAHPGALLRGARAQGRRRRHDHLQPQPRAVERREIQGQLRRRGQPRHHHLHRERTAAARRQSCNPRPHRRGRLRPDLHRRARELRRSACDQALRLPLPHRHDVRRREGLHRWHLHARGHSVRRVPRAS